MMRHLYYLLLVSLFVCCDADSITAQTITVAMNGRVTRYTDDTGVTGNFTQINDPVEILLVYDLTGGNMTRGLGVFSGTFEHHEYDSTLSHFSISIGGLTWEHDYNLENLRVRTFDNTSSDRFDTSGYGVDSSTFPFAQAGLNYFNFQLIDTDAVIWDAAGLPDEEFQFDISSLEFHNGVVQSREINSSIVWSVGYWIDEVSISRAREYALGDCNEDGAVNFMDLQPFIDSLTSGNFQEQADMDESGEVTFLDIAPFIKILSAN